MGTCEEGHDDIAPHEKNTCKEKPAEVVARAVIDDRIVVWTNKQARLRNEKNALVQRAADIDREISRCDRNIQALRLVAGLVDE